MTGMSGDILDVIDGALSDWAVSKDAMRWNPGAGETEARCRNSGGFSLAMLPPAEPVAWAEVAEWSRRGFSSFRDLDPAPVVAQIEEGHIIEIDGCPWRVTSRERTSQGTWRFSLEPARQPS